MKGNADEIDGAMSSLLREMHAEGHIDNQFEQLLMLQDDSEPDFVRSVMELFFQVRADSGATLECLMMR
jgi:histidine-containing phosphotransfer peotein